MRLNKQYWQWRYRKASLRAWRALCSRLYRDQYPDTARTTLVAGVARSGTTWIGDIIASQVPSRILFEPFNPRLVEPYQEFNYYQYMRPEDKHPALDAYCRNLFRGNIRHHWIDRQVTQLVPQYRVVKVVRGNLMLKWINDHFPEVPQVLVIRHPCAVVLSWMQLGWAADENIAHFLEQQKLIDDYLLDKLEIIKRAETEEEKLAIIWCIGNLIPLSQFQPGEVHITYYEHMCIQPEIEIPALFQAINREYQDSVFELLIKPSTTSRPHSAFVTGQDRVMRWQQVLPARKADRILSTVRAFGLDHLYGESAYPFTDNARIESPSSTHD